MYPQFFNQAKENEQTAQFGERKQMLPPPEMVYRAEEEYWGAHVDHFMNFFEGMRTGDPIVEDAVFGLRAAAPALACNNSLVNEQTIRWDPVNLRLVD